jgi:hypothetical protein
MAKVKIFCDCGTEIWQDLPDFTKDRVTLGEAEALAECSDCVMAKVLDTESRRV